MIRTSVCEGYVLHHPIRSHIFCMGRPVDGCQPAPRMWRWQCGLVMPHARSRWHPAIWPEWPNGRISTPSLPETSAEIHSFTSDGCDGHHHCRSFLLPFPGVRRVLPDLRRLVPMDTRRWYRRPRVPGISKGICSHKFQLIPGQRTVDDHCEHGPIFPHFDFARASWTRALVPFP